MRDPYSLLGVQRNAGVNEIKAAFRTKAKSIHPDHNQDDPMAGDRFAEVGQAYELLKDPERRKRYDRASDMQQTIMEKRESARQAAERAKAAKANAEKIMEELARANARRAQSNAQAAAQNQAETQGPAAAGPSPKGSATGATAGAGEPAEDMIERIFGADPQTQAKAEEQPRAADAKKASEHAAEDAAPSEPADPDSVETKPLPVLAVDLIASLVRRIRGTNAAPEKAPDISVAATVTVDDLLHQTAVHVKLPDERDVRVPLERGMTEGQVLRLKGQGLKVPNMKTGDLLVNLRLAREPQYRVDGFDIHTVLPVSLEDAVLGTEVSVDTPDGPRQVAVPAWSGSDQTLRIEGLGLHTGGGTRGDLIVELRILLWEKPDPKVTDLMRHMRQGLFL